MLDMCIYIYIYIYISIYIYIDIMVNSVVPASIIILLGVKVAGAYS
jgi:hypothetical protein